MTNFLGKVPRVSLCMMHYIFRDSNLFINTATCKRTVSRVYTHCPTTGQNQCTWTCSVLHIPDLHLSDPVTIINVRHLKKITISQQQYNKKGICLASSTDAQVNITPFTELFLRQPDHCLQRFYSHEFFQYLFQMMQPYVSVH